MHINKFRIVSIITAASICCLAAPNNIRAQTGAKSLTRIQYGASFISGIGRMIVTNKNGKEADFSFRAPTSRLLHLESTDPARHITLEAPKMTGKARVLKSGTKNLEIDTARASGGVHLVLKLKDKGAVTNTISAQSSQMTYYAAASKIVMEGDVTVTSADQNLSSNSEILTLTFKDGGYVIDAGSGGSEADNTP